MSGTTGPIGKRRIPLDAGDRSLLLAVSPRLGFSPNGYRIGPKATWTIRTALAYAKLAHIEPGEPVVVPPSTGGLLPMKIDTAGLFDDLDVVRLASVIRRALRHYAKDGVPTDRQLANRSGTWMTLPLSLLSDIALNAFINRRVAEVEAVETIEEAMRKELDRLPADERTERPMDVHLRIDEALAEKFRERAGLTGHDADTLLWRAAREVARERRASK